MGQAGCQTLSQSEITYMRSDIIRLRRDVADIKKQLGTPLPDNYQGIVRNQAAQREALVELKDGQQRTESRIEETRYELAALRQEITNLKLNLISQMEAMRAAGGTAAPQQQQPLQTPAPTPVAPQIPSVDPQKPPPLSTPVSPPVVPKTVTPKREEPIDYTKLYDTAYEDYQRQNYSLARNGFEEYLRLFPDTDLVDNAQYWIGECYYAEGEYEKATQAFKEVITRYPTGNKVPRAMLKAGHALLQMGQNEEAAAMFQQVIDAYPLSSEADQAKIKLEKLR
jgi:tol-pal system protein YbgF